MEFSPFRYRAILISPNRVFPIVPFPGGLPHGFFIYLDPKARPFRDSDISIRVIEHGRMNQVIVELGADVIVNTEALFPDEGIGSTTIKLKAGSNRYNEAQRKRSS